MPVRLSGVEWGMKMEDLETKKLRDSLMEYEGYLREMRQVTLKNMETLDVIQRYTDKSAAGMQKLAEQSLEGIQRVTAESAGGLRRMIETGTGNINQNADAGAESIRLAVEEGVKQIGQLAEERNTGIARLAQDALERLDALASTGEEHVKTVAAECLGSLRSYADASMEQITSAYEKSRETAEIVEKIEAAILEHMDTMKELLKQSDDFTHKENVKVYRNVQAVVVDEVKKQTEAMAAQNEDLAAQNAMLQKQNKGLRPLVIVTLLGTLANIALMAARIAGLF